MISDGVECVFQANMNNRALVVMKLAIFLIATAIKIGLVLLDAAVVWFAAIMSLSSQMNRRPFWLYAKGGQIGFRFAWVKASSSGCLKRRGRLR